MTIRKAIYVAAEEKINQQLTSSYMFPVYIIQLFRRAKARKKLIGLEKVCNKTPTDAARPVVSSMKSVKGWI